MTVAASATGESGRQSDGVFVEGLQYRYPGRKALDGVSFAVSSGEIFGILGPNGGGKTTLFRILATLTPFRDGEVRILGLDARRATRALRRRIGVVFQHPSVDGKLSVRENVRFHGQMYGLSGARLEQRAGDALTRLGLEERADERVETLSGGLKRRVELAKGLLSEPDLLILDEPSTGLDPGARRDLWQHLKGLRRERGTTILVTTHLMDEAEQCDHLAILDQGRIVSSGSPSELRGRIGGDVITIRAADPERLAERIQERFGDAPSRVDGLLRLERPDGHVFIKQLFEAFAGDIDGVSLGKPTLEDVFVHETGHRFWDTQ